MSELTKTQTPIASAQTVRAPRQSFWANSPRASTLATKMVPDKRRGIEPPSDEGVNITDEAIFNNIVSNRAKKNLDNKTLIELNPDLKLIREMLKSTIMSPLAMENDEVYFRAGESEIPPSVSSGPIEIIRKHFNEYIGLPDMLPDCIGEALFDAGSSPWVVISESAIDDIINNTKTNGVSMESVRESLRSEFIPDTPVLRSTGILGDCVIDRKNPKATNNNRPAMENWFMGGWRHDLPPDHQKIHNNLYITDNSAALRLPILNDRLKSSLIRETVFGKGIGTLDRTESVSQEGRSRSYAKFDNLRKLQQSLYYPRGRGGDRISNTRVVENSANTSRSPIGHPLLLKMYGETFIPVFVPGNEKNHIGYLALLDQSGYPLNVTDEMARFMRSGFGVGMAGGMQMNMTSILIQQANIMQNGYCQDLDKRDAEERLKIYERIMEENVLNRIKNGLNGKAVTFSNREEFMRVMLMRTFANELTQILYVPAEQAAYLAYEYDTNGMGKSLLDDVKQITTIRTMANFANFMAAVKNAVGRTKVTINVDERDPDPEKASAILRDEFLRAQAGITPTEVSTSDEMFRVLRQMAVTFEFQGNPRMPNTSVAVEDTQSSKPMIDNEFMDRLRNQIYMGLYVTPEMVDATQGSDFAITRWTSNQLFAKRIKQLQKITERFIKKLVTVYVCSDGDLVGQMQREIEANLEKVPERFKGTSSNGGKDVLYREVIETILETLVVELPSPDNVKNDTQLEQLNKYVALLDVGLQAYVSNEILSGAVREDDRDYIQSFVDSTKAFYVRQWMAENNVLPELLDLTRRGTEENPALNILKEHTTHVTNLVTNVGDWGKGIQKLRDEYVTQLEETNPRYAEALNGGADASSSTSTDDTTDTDTDPTDMSDDGMPTFDAPEDDTSTDDTPPEDTGDENPGDAPTSAGDSGGDQPAEPSAPM